MTKNQLKMILKIMTTYLTMRTLIAKAKNLKNKIYNPAKKSSRSKKNFQS